MSDSVKKIKIASYDDLFNPISSDSFDEGTPAKVLVDQLTPFPHHPFKLYQDERMQEMVQSIRSNGVLTPILVRPSKESSGYEIISGHNRVEAAKLAGLSEVPAIIRQMDDETAIVAMVDSNLRQREKLLPSEKAFAFKMKLDAMRRKAGRPPSNNSGQLDLNYSKKQSRDLMAEQIGESGKQINRYIRLTELIPLALDCVDQGRLAFNLAVAISYLNPDQQRDLLDIINEYECSPSLSQAERLKALSQNNQLDRSAINAVMSELKPQQNQVVIKSEYISKYFPKDASSDQIQDTIIKLLEAWYRRRNQDVSR